MNYKKHITLLIGIVALLTLTCKDQTEQQKNITSGMELAKIHCGRCHEMPSPSALSKGAWEKGVLPEMAYYLGMSPTIDKMFSLAEDEYPELIGSKLFPSKPLLSQTQWDSLIQYYISNAPDSVESNLIDTIVVKKNLAKVSTIYTKENLRSNVSLVANSIDQKSIFISNEGELALKQYDTNLHLLQALPTSSAVSDIAFDQNKKYIIQIGNINPNDRKQGKLSVIDEKNVVTDLVKSLKRPVDLNHADMNKDGTKDFIICNYGNLVGNVTWYDGKTLKENKISDNAGPRISQLCDLDLDGKKELVVLFCQGNEHISIFEEKEGYKKEKVLMRFPPQQGSSYMEMKDVNGDQFLDLLYANGDNADLSIELKPYHGFTIYLNDGKNNFKKAYQYQMPGCGKLIAADIDKDGDLDYALISYFPKHPSSGYVLLKQVAPMVFEPYRPNKIDQGNWLVMDYNSDANAIFIGSYNRGKSTNGKQAEVMKIKY
jgi:hypothetical protein